MKPKTKKPSAPNVIVRQGCRNVSRKEAFDKAQVGFDPAYKNKWVEKVGWSRAYEEGWNKIKKAV